MSRTHSRSDDDPRSQYGFARAFALAWLNMNGFAVDDMTSAPRIARMLSLQVHGDRKGHAKKAIVDWHLTAITASREAPAVLDDDFYSSQAWRAVRYQALRNCNGRCTLCGSPPGRHSLHVDHIKPRSLFPALALEPSNLQVLCRDCNLGKSNKDATDWRTARREATVIEGEYSDHAIGRMLRQIA